MRAERAIPFVLALLLVGLSGYLYLSKSRSITVPLEWEGDPAVTLFYQHDCTTCHTVRKLPDARGTLGPGLDGVASIARRLDPEGGGKDYLRESLLDPSAAVRKGFIDAMPSYKGVLSDEEVEILVDWLLGLEDSSSEDALPGEPVRVLPTRRP